MRHSVFGRKLSRTKNERRRLFAGLLRDLILHNAISTSIAKAKAVQPIVDKLITKAKLGKDSDRRNVTAVLIDRKLTEKLFDDANTRFSTRNSGYTRIIKLGKRKSDATEMCMLSFVDENIVVEQIAPKKTAVVAPIKKAAEKKVEAKEVKKEVKKTVKKVKKA